MKSKLKYLRKDVVSLLFYLITVSNAFNLAVTNTKPFKNTFELHVMLLSHYEGLKYFVPQEVGLVVFHRIS